MTLNEACTRLAGLSEERARKVVSLIEDLSELELLENSEDILAAKKALQSTESILWSSLKSELDALHDSR